MLRCHFAAALALAVLAAAGPALAAPKPSQAPVCVDMDAMRPCKGPTGAARRAQRVNGAFIRNGRAVLAAGRPARPRGFLAGSGESRIIEHPAGCPARLFCACGAAVRVFGRPIRSLWLAAAWFKFPRAAPAPMRAAVRRHHVFVLLEHVEADIWRVYDANSGGHRTRIHLRSIRGYVIVDPRGRAAWSAFKGAIT